jgi:hypothetical protein
MSNAESTIHQFLERYEKALGSGDLRVIADCWGIPSFVLSDDGAQPITESKEVEAFFGNAVAQYQSQGFASTHAEIKKIERLSPQMTSVDVRWSNLDKAGTEKASESYRYILKASADGKPRIHVAIPKLESV